VKAVREEEVKLCGIGFVKEVGFKPTVKERKRNSDEYRYMYPTQKVFKIKV